MIEGVVNTAHEAVVPLSLRGTEGRTQEIEAVVDTGYTGFLTLPPALVDELGLPFAYVSRAFLANDDEVEFNVHDVTVLWDGLPRQVRAAATGSVPLLGMAMLDAHSLYVAVTEGGPVVIQLMPESDIRTSGRL